MKRNQNISDDCDQIYWGILLVIWIMRDMPCSTPGCIAVNFPQPQLLGFSCRSPLQCNYHIQLSRPGFDLEQLPALSLPRQGTGAAGSLAETLIPLTNKDSIIQVNTINIILLIHVLSNVGIMLVTTDVNNKQTDCIVIHLNYPSLKGRSIATTHQLLCPCLSAQAKTYAFRRVINQNNCIKLPKSLKRFSMLKLMI